MISNSETDINEMDITIQNKPLEISWCTPNEIILFYDKAVIDGDRTRVKKRGDSIIISFDGGSFRHLIKGDEMVLKIYDKKGDRSLTATFNKAPENRYE